MQIWNYDASGVLLNSGWADPNPLTPGDWLIPGHATTIEPPVLGEKQVAVFANGAWSIVADHRGETWYAGYGQPVVIAALGVPEGLTETEPEAPPPTIAELKLAAADKRWRVETGGVSADLGAGPMTIPSDDRAKMLLLGASVSMTNEATGPYVVNSVSVTLTGAQFKALYAAIFAHVEACFTAQTALIAAIDAGTVTTLAQIEAWNWPA